MSREVPDKRMTEDEVVAELHSGMTIGIEQFRAPRDLWLDRMLLQPFLGEVGDYPINRRSDSR